MEIPEREVNILFKIAGTFNPGPITAFLGSSGSSPTIRKPQITILFLITLIEKMIRNAVRKSNMFRWGEIIRSRNTNLAHSSRRPEIGSRRLVSKEER